MNNTDTCFLCSEKVSEKVTEARIWRSWFGQDQTLLCLRCAKKMYSLIDEFHDNYPKIRGSIKIYEKIEDLFYLDKELFLFYLLTTKDQHEKDKL